jgi:hypothetical protein
MEGKLVGSVAVDHHQITATACLSGVGFCLSHRCHRVSLLIDITSTRDCQLSVSRVSREIMYWFYQGEVF